MLAYQADADEPSCLFPGQTFDDECRARLPLMETSASCSADQQRLSQWNIKMTLSEKKRQQMEGNGGAISAASFQRDRLTWTEAPRRPGGGVTDFAH